MSSKYARRTDANHAQIIQGLRAFGVAVLDLHALGGALDALAGFRGVLTLLEIKDGAKAPSRRKLTDAERATIALFTANDCPVYVVENLDQAARAVGVVVISQTWPATTARLNAPAPGGTR